MPVTLNERLRLSATQWREILRQELCDLRVACPGIIQSFDATTQTATVQLALREPVVQPPSSPGTPVTITHETVPIIPDVPVVLPRAGGYALTLPITEGDECLVIFGDACIDSWWQAGGVQNLLTGRRHSLSDAIAVVGLWNQTRVLNNYSSTTAQLRTDDGDAYIELASGHVVNIVAPGGLNINGDVVVQGTVEASGEGTFNSIEVSQHVHPDVQSGSSNTGKPTG